MNMPPALQHLDTIPIETLGLSHKVLRLMKWYGLTTVGQCVVFYIENAPVEGRRSTILTLLMYGDVERQMKVHGFWKHVMDAALWQTLRDIQAQNRYEAPKKVVLWQGEEQDLYRVPVAALGLSDTAIASAKAYGMDTIGKWLRNYRQLYLVSPNYREGIFPINDEYFDMMREIWPKMKDQSFWPLFEDEFSLET